MTQRIFDTDNEKDMADLWYILPSGIKKLFPNKISQELCLCSDWQLYTPIPIDLIKINWHDKTEIIRPIQEATEQDIGKLCCFGDVEPNKKLVGLLGCVDSESTYCKYMMRGGTWFPHCRRLTKQEIEELL